MIRIRGLLGGLAIAATAAAALLSAGCGTGGIEAAKGTDVTRGKQLFVQKCGSCHTLADAGTQGKVGPNLDDAFSGPRAQGFKESSIRNIVHDQILFPDSDPSGVIKGPNGAEQPVQGMPAKIVTGQDAKDVAAYVASVAGASASSATPGQAAATSSPRGRRPSSALAARASSARGRSDRSTQSG